MTFWRLEDVDFVDDSVVFFLGDRGIFLPFSSDPCILSSKLFVACMVVILVSTNKIHASGVADWQLKSIQSTSIANHRAIFQAPCAGIHRRDIARDGSQFQMAKGPRSGFSVVIQAQHAAS